MKGAKAVVFDWAGTVIDFGSFAPVKAFIKAFAEFGIEASIAQAREPMGMPKYEHVLAMLASHPIATQWHARFGREPNRNDAEKIYQAFLPINVEVAGEHTGLVPGTRTVVSALRQAGIKIGSTTGYTRAIMETVRGAAAAQGFSPDNLVCADDLPETRPGPLGMYQCFIDLHVYPPACVVKVDDTAPGIAEGLSAGCLTVGVMLSGNECGKTPDELAAMSDRQINEIRVRAGACLRAAGAHYLIDTVADLPELILGRSSARS